jgi:hypothetical protein
MPPAKRKPVTLKQRQFAEAYVRTNGNGTKAAKLAGYAEPSAHSIASENLRKPKVAAIIAHLTRKHEISADRVLTRLDNLSLDAAAEGNYSAAVKAEELIGKSLGMWVERSLNVNVDASAAHLEALRALIDRRSHPSHALQGGDDASRIMDVMENADDD